MTIKEQTNNLCEKIKISEKFIDIIATGCGAGVLPLLWSQPGISAVLSNFSFPYAAASTESILGFKPSGYSSLDTAVDLAQTAYKRSWHPGKEVVGVGVAGAVSTSVERKGNNRVHICVFSKNHCRTLSASLPLNSNRQKDGEITDYLAISFLALACGIDNNLFENISKQYNFESFEYNHNNEKLSRERFLAHNYFSKDDKRLGEMDVPFSNLILFPGSFNPFHEGHRGIAQKLCSTPNTNFIFEISTDCLHKDSLTVPDMLQRAKGLQGNNLLFTQGCPLYVGKAERFQNSSIVLGSDSLQRMMDPKWCSNQEKLVESFLKFKTKFIVFGREFGGHWNDLFTITNQYPVIKKLNTTAIKGRWDISSTELRNKK